MRLTIIPEDRFIRVDGEAVEWPSTVSVGDENIRAVQWYDTFGSIEYYSGPAKRIEELPTEITNIVNNFSMVFNSATKKQTGIQDSPIRTQLIEEEKSKLKRK